MQEPHLEEDRSAKFSPSKLDVYKNCPRRYQYRYVDKISRVRKTPETALGVAVHAAFEELYGRVAGGQVPTLADVQGWYEKAFEEEWDASVVVKDATFSKDDWRRVGTSCVELYHAAHAPFKEDRTVAVEKKVGFPIEVDGREYRVEGFVDRLALAPDGAFEIVDYKTAKSLPNQEHADADWQLALYELAVRREWPDAKEVRLKWHYVRHGKTLVSVRTPEAREALRADAAALISQIKHDHVFNTKRSALCDWCEYKDLCPEFSDKFRVEALSKAELKKDDAVRLVGDLAEIEAKRKKLGGELKALDVERDRVHEDLAGYAEKAGISVVYGEGAEASVKFKTEAQLPTKTHEPEKLAELEKEARATPLWAEVARLDAHALKEGVRLKKWPAELLEAARSLIERFGRAETKAVVRLKSRKEPDEE